MQLIPDKKEYAGGDTAELLVQAPFFPAEGVVTWRRSGIVKTERISLTSATTTIKVPIADAMTPNIYVQVDLVGAATRSDDKGDPDPKLPKRPAYAVGALNLSVPPKQRTLAVKVAPAAAKLSPGETTTLAVEVDDANGKPVPNAETAVIVVDEAVLALTGYQFADPISTFYPGRGTGATDYYLRSYVKLSRPDAGALAQNAERTRARSIPMPSTVAVMAPMAAPVQEDDDGAMPMAKSEAMEADKPARGGALGSPPPSPDAAGPAIAIRSDFNPLAAFSPTVTTGADGKANVTSRCPIT